MAHVLTRDRTLAGLRQDLDRETGLVPVPVLVWAGGAPVIDAAETPILTPSEVAGWIQARPPVLNPDRGTRIARRVLEAAR